MPFPGGSGHTQPVPAPRSEHVLHLHIRQAQSDPAAPEAGVPHPADCSSLLLPAERARALPGRAQLSLLLKALSLAALGQLFTGRKGGKGRISPSNLTHLLAAGPGKGEHGHSSGCGELTS